MLCKLSVSNIRRSLRDYAIYFFTLLIGVSVFYVFNAIGGQASMMELGESKNEIVVLITNALSYVSIFVAGVLGLLIVYASRFLMKRRNREFALYMTLGMSKGKISAILLLETVIIGVLSLGTGLLLGIGLSQLMSALVAHLFEADMSAYRFMISGNAIVKTVIFFAVMYLVVMVFNSVMISRFKLIDLMQSGKKSEQIKLKNPVLCVIIFLLSAAVLGYTYYQVGWNYDGLNRTKCLLSFAAGTVTTFLLFWSVAGMLLRVMMSAKNTYFRSLNAFTFRQISSKINTAVLSMSVICLMLFITICTLTSAFSIRNSMNANLRELCPADFEIEWGAYSDKELETPVFEDIVEKYEINGFDINEYFRESVHFHIYEDSSLTLGTFLGNQLEAIRAEFPFLRYDTVETVVRLSDYNKLLQLYGKEPLEMNADECIILANYSSMIDVRNRVLSLNQSVEVFGHTLHSRYPGCVDGFISMSGSRTNLGIIVIPDEIADERFASRDYFIGRYAAESEEQNAEIEKAVKKQFDLMLRADSDYREYTADGEPTVYNWSMTTSKIDICDDSIGIGALITFLGLYIGLIFLISCGAVLALKELSESVDSIPRYVMLRKIGAEEKEITKSLLIQTGFFFLLPLLLACIHSAVGMKFAVYVLSVFGTEDIGASILSTSLILLLIYGGYFLITYSCSKGIVKERK
ncbi:MAG: FtsX-like permease family protein [Oscillospiraceae bacterium]|nr:FtsX-like permease family protein [Oscillospiraceae bacterium]